jgi:hypothetical protein
MVEIETAMFGAGSSNTYKCYICVPDSVIYGLGGANFFRTYRNVSMTMRHFHKEFSVAMDHYFLASVY